MKIVKIIIEKSKDMYSSYAENVPGIYGGGDTVEEAKKSALEAINLLKEYNTPENVPAILNGEYRVVYKMDAESFFKYYKPVLTIAGMEKLTGIKQRQLQHYSSGLKKPRLAQLKKIEAALHDLGRELLAVEL